MEYNVIEPGRLDAFLTSQFPQISRSRLQKRIKSGSVSVNGTKVTKVAYLLHIGDDVAVSEESESLDTKHTSIDSVDLELPILYEDDDCFVIQKPAGYSVHPGHNSEEYDITILHGIAFEFKKRAIPFRSDAVLVHRLDKDTTGCLLIAKTPEAHFQLQKQFEARIVNKQYLAIVYGVPKNSSAIIDAPIGRNMNDRTKMSVLQTSKSKPAKTGYKIVDYSDKASLLCCDLFTGRTHQIRVHLSSVNHPILGDSTYNSPASKKFSAQNQIKQICLHAWKLSFTSLDAKNIDVVCDPPPYFAKIANVLKLDLNLNPKL